MHAYYSTKKDFIIWIGRVSEGWKDETVTKHVASTYFVTTSFFIILKPIDNV